MRINYKHSLKTKKKMRKRWKETHEGWPWNKGTKGLCKPNSGSFKKGMKLSEETRLKIGLTLKGKKKPIGFSEKLSKIKKGQPSPNKNKPMSEEQKRKLSKAHLKRWDLKGRKKYHRSKHGGSKYIQWRKKVYERDKYICIICKIKGGQGKTIYLEAHHIKSWINYPKLRYIVNNGITVCKKCHKKLHKRKETKLCAVNLVNVKEHIIE